MCYRFLGCRGIHSLVILNWNTAFVHHPSRLWYWNRTFGTVMAYWFRRYCTNLTLSWLIYRLDSWIRNQTKGCRHSQDPVASRLDRRQAKDPGFVFEWILSNLSYRLSSLWHSKKSLEGYILSRAQTCWRIRDIDAPEKTYLHLFCHEVVSKSKDGLGRRQDT